MNLGTLDRRLLGVAAIGFFVVAALTGCGSSEGGAEATAKTAISVKTQKIEPQELVEQLTAYGQAVPNPDAVRGISVLHGGQVEHLNVGVGQRVKAGDQLLTLATEPQARLAYQQAQAELKYAKSNLNHVRDLYKQQLATNAQLADAKKALQNAESALAAQKRQGNGSAITAMRAPFSGIVTAVNVSPGDRVQANAVLMDLVNGDRLWVKLGVEPETLRKLHEGLPVALHPVFYPAVSISAQITQLHAAINPSTQLVDALVALTQKQTGHLIPGMWVRGTITVRRAKMLAVPHAAVLTDKRGAYIFTVRNGKAQRVDVSTDFTGGPMIGVKGAGLRAGEPVVTVGNYELRDGMAVREQSE